MTRGIAIETQSMELRSKVTSNGSDLEDSKTECSAHASISLIEGFPVAGWSRKHTSIEDSNRR